MTSYSLSNVLLPAVLLSSAVFSTLTVPLALIRNEPTIVELRPFFSVEIQPIFKGEQKEIAIPYVGFVIVVSVGTGIASVEVNRRWQAYHSSEPDEELLENIQQKLQEKEGQTNESELPEYRPEISAINLSLKDKFFENQPLKVPNKTTESQDIIVEASEAIFDATQLASSQLTIPEKTTASTTVFEELNMSQVLRENNSVQFISSIILSPESTTQEKNLTPSKFLESRKEYQTCRIKVPHFKQRLFAIKVNDQYYSFLRAENTKEKVLEIMAKLDDQVKKIVITKTEKGYAIWNWEPEARRVHPNFAKIPGCEHP